MELHKSISFPGRRANVKAEKKEWKNNTNLFVIARKSNLTEHNFSLITNRK